MPDPADELIDDPNERLRAAFAKLMLQGQGNTALPVEGIWAQQAARQALRNPPPPPVPFTPDALETPGVSVGMPEVAMPKDLTFPTADPAGTQAATMEASKPFPGAQSVEVVKPPASGNFALPKSPEKKAKEAKGGKNG